MSVDASREGFGRFDYGLSPAEEARAGRLHGESVICDLLYWGPCAYLSCTPEMERELEAFWERSRDPIWTSLLGIFQAQRLAARGNFPSFKECWDASGLTAGSRMLDGFSSVEYLLFCLGHNQAMFDGLPWVRKALCAEDIRRAKAEGKHAAWLNTQLMRGVDESFPRLLEAAHAAGLRMVMLTYNTMNILGSGCTERTDAGISRAGARAIAAMNELGIIVDTAHCGRQTTLDACRLSKKPVVASHTSAKGVFACDRGKSDEELRRLAGSGGVIGLVTNPQFLGPGREVDMWKWLDHLDYIVDLVGWEHAAIGTDWPMPLPKATLQKAHSRFVEDSGWPVPDPTIFTDNLIGFDDYRDLPNITRGLVKRGYGDQQIRGILGENFLRVFQEVCG
jgi:membrane dipeptidase